MTHALDLTRHAFVRTLGDITVYGTWLFNDDIEDTEPALVLVPSYRTNGYKPVAIALSAAFRYNNPRYLAHASQRFAKALGFEDSIVVANKIATIIFDHLGDLIRMPVDPREAVVVGEATVRHSDGSKQTAAILDHEQVRQV